MFKVKNKGLSYLELVVSITIAVLLTAFFTISLTTAHRNNVNRARDKMEVSIKTAKNNALARGSANGWVSFYLVNNRLYCYEGKEIDFDTNKADLDSSSQKWELVANNVSEFIVDTVTLTDGKAVTIGFKQSTGELSGFKFPNSSTQPIHHLDSSYPQLKISLTIGNKSQNVMFLDRFGNIK